MKLVLFVYFWFSYTVSDDETPRLSAAAVSPTSSRSRTQSPPEGGQFLAYVSAADPITDRRSQTVADGEFGELTGR